MAGRRGGELVRPTKFTRNGVTRGKSRRPAATSVTSHKYRYSFHSIRVRLRYIGCENFPTVIGLLVKPSFDLASTTPEKKFILHANTENTTSLLWKIISPLNIIELRTRDGQLKFLII